jgi:hypothetical protein
MRLNTLRAESDQAVALVGAAILQDALREAISCNMRELTQVEQTRLFSNGGPLESFSSLIHFAYAMEIVGPMAKADLHCICDIRNAFAHAKLSISFTSSELSNACAGLVTPNKTKQQDGWSHDNPRDRYLITVWHLWSRLFAWGSLRKGDRLSQKLFGGPKNRGMR